MSDKGKVLHCVLKKPWQQSTFKQLIDELTTGDAILFHVETMTKYKNKLLNATTIDELKEICCFLISKATQSITYYSLHLSQNEYPYSAESAKAGRIYKWSNINKFAQQLVCDIELGERLQ